MGNFFTSTQIYSSDAAERDKFIDTFCKAMEKEGYIPCNCDEAEKSYILKFADNCNWVTVTSEEYGEGNQIALSDTGRIAKMLKTTCINTTVIDSDCAVMEMYGKSGKKANTLIVGDADEYFGDDTLKPSEKAWKPFLAEGMTWEQLCNILNNSEGYTFVEDCLSALAPIIGMDDSNILFSAEDAEEGDKQTVFLGFKKAEAKEKKLTLNAAFTQVFGAELEPRGFIKLKNTKNPCYVRIIGEGIINVITFRNMSASKTGYKKIEYRIGILSIYSLELFLQDPTSGTYNTLVFYKSDYYKELNIKPKNETINNLIDYEFDIWNIDKNNYWYNVDRCDFFSDRIWLRDCSTTNNLMLLRALNCDINIFKDIILPIMDKVTNNDEYINFCYSFRRPMTICDSIEEFDKECGGSGDSLLLIKTNCLKNLNKYLERELAEAVDTIKSGRSCLAGAKDIDDFKKRIRTEWEQQEKIRSKILSSPELKKQFLDRMEQIKQYNIELLSHHGFIFSKECFNCETN